MNINLEILDKSEKNISEDIKVTGTTDIMEIKEVKAIRNAVREHLLFIGLDRGNNVRNISVLGIGSSCAAVIDSKDIVRTALLSSSDRVVLVHNHPSNSIEPSKLDIHITSVANKILDAFNIELLDHIIVTEREYASLKKLNLLDKNFDDKKLENMSKGLLIEENIRLKNQIEKLEEKIKENEFDLEMEA